MFNSIFVSGNLGKDPIKNTSKLGNDYYKFSIAIRITKDETLWMNVIYFSNYDPFLKKGDYVVLGGRLNKFKTKTGEEVPFISCEEIKKVDFGDKKKVEDIVGKKVNIKDNFDDEIPF